MKLTKKVYRTAMGKQIDMQTLMLQNEKTVALGNASLNARGDEIDSRGNIVKKREELAQDYYRANPKAVKDAPLEEDNVVSTQEKLKKKTTAKTEPVASQLSEADMKALEEYDNAADQYASEIIKNKER
jgi:hypothetical protein